MTNKIFLSLGSNDGDRIKNLHKAISSIKKIAEINRISSFYLTEPVDVVKQNDFINLALEISTAISPERLLSIFKEIEIDMGRDVTKVGQPRTIDIDIVFYSSNIYTSNNIQIPHPRAHNRAFVIYPIMEIDQEFIHPTLNKSILEISRKLPKHNIVKLKDIEKIK